MSFEAGSIFYTIKADTSALLTADKEVSNFNKKAQEGFEKTSVAMSKLTTIAKAVSVALVSNQVISYAQSWNELEDRIQNTGATAAQTKDILEQLLLTSNRNGRTIEESSELYINLSNSMKELGYSTQGTLNYIDTLSNLFTINKTKSLAAESAINALTKAQMNGKLSGLEALTVFKAMPSILKTLSNQLKKNAKTTEEADKITEEYVRRLASEGKLSMKMFTNAMIEAQAETAALANNMRNTIQDGLTRITNNLKKYCGELNNSMGATKLIVDSLILMSEHVNILMTSVGALAAIYAGRYITSLANATKQSVEKTIADIRQAKAEKLAAQAALQHAQAELANVRAVQQSLIAQLNLAQTERTRNAIRVQLRANTQALIAATNAETAAQTRLNTAMKATSFVANGLRSAMALLGGPAGILFLAAGALMMWSNKASEARQKALDLKDEIASLAEKYKDMSKTQKQLFEDELKSKVMDQYKEIEKQERKIANIKNKIAVGYGKGANEEERIAKLKKEIEAEEKVMAVMQEGFKQLVDLMDEVKVKNHELSNATDDVTQSAGNLAKGWDEASKKEIDKKIVSLSKELDVATLKTNKQAEAAFILDGLYSVLGDSANEYKDDLIDLLKGQSDFTKFTQLTQNQVKELQPLIEKYKSLFQENAKQRNTTKDYATEVKKLNEELEILQKSYGDSSVSAQIFKLEQETNTKVIGEERIKLEELLNLMNGYKAIGEIKNPIKFEEDSFNNAKTALDDWLEKNPDKYSDYYSKLEQLEKEHQINLAKIKSDAVVSKVDDAVAQVDPVQALQNENARKLALIQEFENQKWITEQNAIALREAANHQYEQNRINAQWEIWRNQSDANEFLASSLEGLANSATSTISGLVSGTMTATQAMQNFANVILNEAIGSLVQMGMQYVKNSIVAQSTSAATTASQITAAEALAIAYQPAAMLASIATQGTAATIGAESYMTALGAMKAYTIAGARKNGGPVAANSMYRVGEGNKPEILMQGGRQYLIPGENGQVLSNRQINSDNGNNIQWNFIVQNYASNVEVSQPSIDVEKKIIRMAVKESKQAVAGDINNHSGEVWNALNNSTNIHPKL